MNQRALRFCMVTTFYPPYSFGGDGIFVYRLANELAERGHHVTVVHCLDAYRLLSLAPVPSQGDYPNHPNVTVHSLTSKVQWLSPLITHQTGYPGLKAFRLKEIMNHGNFDIFHFHNISLMGLGALKYGCGIKLYTLHEHWLVCPLHVLWKFNRLACTVKHCLTCTIHGKRPPQLWRYTNLLSTMVKHVDAFISPSMFTWNKHREMGLAVETLMVNIPHFLPLPSSLPLPINEEQPPFRPYFLYAGRLEKLKGVQVLIEVFRMYRKADLLIAGDGNHEKHLKQQAQDLPNVKFLGRLKYDQLRILFHNAIAVVVSSVGYEVFPLITLEAFAHRTPLIVHNLGPLAEIVEQSRGGLIYQDKRELLEALETLRKNTDLRQELGERGYQAYLKYWTPEPHMQEYFKLIQRIADKKQGSLAT